MMCRVLILHLPTVTPAGKHRAHFLYFQTRPIIWQLNLCCCDVIQFAHTHAVETLFIMKLNLFVSKVGASWGAVAHNDFLVLFGISNKSKHKESYLRVFIRSIGFEYYSRTRTAKISCFLLILFKSFKM